jgi:hypothetical protein
MPASQRRRDLAIYSTNLDELTLAGFVLETRILHSRLHRCLELEALLRKLAAHPYKAGSTGIRLAVIIHEGRMPEAVAATEHVLQSLDEEFPEVPVLLVDLPNVFRAGAALADVRLAGVCSATALINAARTLMLRKRGPIRAEGPQPASAIVRPPAQTPVTRMMGLAEKCA